MLIVVSTDLFWFMKWIFNSSFSISLGLIVMFFAISGCQTGNDYNSFVEIGSFDVEVIEDFVGPGTEGFEFSKGVVRSIRLSGLFSQILQEKPQG